MHLVMEVASRISEPVHNETGVLDGADVGMLSGPVLKLKVKSIHTYTRPAF